MADKKSTKTSVTSSKTGSQSGRKSSSSNQKMTSAQRAAQNADLDSSWISPRALAAVAVLALFVLSLIIALKPDGVLLRWLYQFFQGTIGRLTFYVSVPILFWIFYILAFHRQHPAIVRCICLILFIFTFGCLWQQTLPKPELPGGFGAIKVLYETGMAGTSAGVICGGLGYCFRLLLGSILPFIILLLACTLLLMGAVNLTIPSIVKAIRNRPRPEKEELPDLPPQREPAEVVVNTIANKQMQWAERRRQLAENPVIPAKAAEAPVKKMFSFRRNRAEELMNAIDADPEAPVAASAQPIAEPPAEIFQEDSVPVSCEEPVREEYPVREEHPAQEEHPVREEHTAESAVMAASAASPDPEPVTEPEIPVPVRVPVKMPVSKAAELVEDDEEENEAEPAVQQPIPQVKLPVDPANKKVSSKEAAESAAQVAAEIEQKQNEQPAPPEYCYPPIDLLHKPVGSSGDGTDEMRENSRRLNETLASFKIEAHIINVTRGPSVTRYEVELEKGVRLNKLTTSADDIALNLGASGVRIAAVPGKISVVGIEVPNRTVTTVSLREVVDSQEFKRAKSKSSFAVGKDIGGNCIVGNIAKLPHMLIAGTTGSGKSVCMNSIIISLLYKSSPEDVKLIMVDPKMVELGIYNGIPHLLIPVVTDPKKAAGSLQWAVTEMMRRYRTMSDAGVRDLQSYNSIVDSQEVEGKHLPQVVVIIDELADLMLVAAKEVEESICRIAQMGRAAGIHLIIATQRPSADVITGLMKANIPSRIAFAVASAMESRIILDTPGAEKLVGKGDMLYAPIGCGKPKRVQGSWVSESEVEAVATFIKSNYQTEYDQHVMEEIDKKAEQTGSKSSEVQPNSEELDGDEMLPEAVKVILETGQASVSMLQRRLKLGYARAARIVDEMEEKGIVGPFMGSKPRSILITREQWEAMRSGGAPVPEEEDSFVPEEDDLDGAAEDLD